MNAAAAVRITPSTRSRTLTALLLPSVSPLLFCLSAIAGAERVVQVNAFCAQLLAPDVNAERDSGTVESAIAAAWAELLTKDRTLTEAETLWLGALSGVADFFTPDARLFDGGIHESLQRLQEITEALGEVGSLDPERLRTQILVHAADLIDQASSRQDAATESWSSRAASRKAFEVLVGHSAAVSSAAFSPDGTKIVTASEDNTARVWDLSGNLLATLTGHTKWVVSAQFSPDGTKIVTASWDTTSRFWDLNGNQLVTLRLRGDAALNGSAFSPDGTKIVTSSWDKTARVWDLSGNLLATLDGHSVLVCSAAFSPDGTTIVTAMDKTARVWDLSGNLLATLKGHAALVYSAAFSSDGTKIVTASGDKTARVWDLNGNLLATLKGHAALLYSAAFSPDGTKIVTASEDNTARVWNLSGNLLATLQGHTDRVRTAAFSPDGTKIVTASGDKTARIWNVEDFLEGGLNGVVEGAKR